MGQGFNRLPEINSNLGRMLAKALDEGSEIIINEIKLSMAEGKSGRAYKASKTGKMHTASAPGEAPAIDTSGLVNSIGMKKVDEYTRVIGTNTEYAGALEFGRSDGKMAARPFMRPAAAKKKDAVIRRIADVLKKFGK